jgi:hypothetical protein
VKEEERRWENRFILFPLLKVMSIVMEAVVLAFKKIGAMTASMQTMDGMTEVVVVIGLLY